MIPAKRHNVSMLTLVKYGLTEPLASLWTLKSCFKLWEAPSEPQKTYHHFHKLSGTPRDEYTEFHV